MRRSTILFATVALLCMSAATTSAKVLQEKFFEVDEFGPDVISDLPCLEGKEFVTTGTVTFRGHSVESAQTFHFNGVEKFAATFVPVDGEGPTYVERGAVDNVSLTDHARNGQFNFSHVISDNFVAFEDGKVVGSERIRIKLIEQFVGVDTDGDGLEDEVKVDILDERVSCPR